MAHLTLNHQFKFKGMDANIASTIGRCKTAYNRLISLHLSIKNVSQVFPPAGLSLKGNKLKEENKNKTKQNKKVSRQWKDTFIT